VLYRGDSHKCAPVHCVCYTFEMSGRKAAGFLRAPFMAFITFLGLAFPLALALPFLAFALGAFMVLLARACNSHRRRHV
jgi:hypothetical protein